MEKLKNRIIVTNNIYVYEKYRESCQLLFDEDNSYMEVLELVRDKVHQGHRVLTHPLSGSVKPNETPYKSILLTGDQGSLDMDSLRIIEESILTCRKFLSNSQPPKWTENVKEDFKTIDLSLIDNVINRLN